MFYCHAARFLASVSLSDSAYWGYAAPLASYLMRTIPSAYHLLLGPRHQPSPVASIVVLQASWPRTLFYIISLQRVSLSLEAAALVFHFLANCILCVWYSNPDTQDAPLQGFRAVWPVLQVLLLGAASWAFHFSKRGQQQNQQPPQRTQHKDHQAVAEAPSYCCCLSLPRSSSEKWASAAEQHDDHAAGSSCAAGASGRQQSSSSIGSWPAGEAAAAAGRETPATAGHAKASSGCSPAASCQTTAGAGAGAATSAEWLLSQPWLAQTQQPQPQPQQHLQTQVKWPAAASTAATSAGGGSSVAALQALRQQLLQGRAAEYAALLLQAPPPPYRSRTRPTTQFAKIRGMELEEVAQDWQKRLQEHLDKQGLMLTGAYIRRGCIELVVEFVRLPTAAAGGASGTAAREGDAKPTAPLSFAQLQQLLQTLPQPLGPPRADAGVTMVAARETAVGAVVDVLRPIEVLGSAAVAPVVQAPLLAACTSFHGPVAGAACWVTPGGQTAAVSPLGTALPPRFLSLHPRVAMLPPPPQQPRALGAARKQQATAARPLLLTLELWFPPSSAGASADGGGSNRAAAAVEVLLRHRHRYLPATARRLQEGGASRADEPAAGIGAAAPASPGEGCVERYEVDVRLGDGESADAVLEPGLLQVDVRWGGLPYMSLPVLLLPSAAAAGGDAAVAAAAAGLAAVDLAAVGEELQRFCDWFGCRGEAGSDVEAGAEGTATREVDMDEDQEDDADEQDWSGSLLYDISLVLFGENCMAVAAGNTDLGDGSSGCGRSGGSGGGTPRAHLLAQRLVGRVVLARDLLQYAEANAMPHLAGLVAGQLVTLQEQLAAAGGGGSLSSSGLGSQAAVGSAGASSDGASGEASRGARGAGLAPVAAADAPPAGGSGSGAGSGPQPGNACVVSGGGSKDHGAHMAACCCDTSPDCDGGSGSTSCGGRDEPVTTSLRSNPAPVRAVAWRALLLFAGMGREAPEEAAAFCEARTAWNLRNAPLIEVFELLTCLSMLARYYVPVAIGPQAPETFTGTVTFIGLVRSGAALIVFTAPLLLAAWVVMPLVLAVLGVPREGRVRAAAQVQQLRQWVRAGPAIWLRYAASVASKALMLALRVSPPPMWRAYSVGLGMVAADGLLLPVACLVRACASGLGVQ
ncbi:hypothetical protein CHLRE_04g227050v5 [Chlamydomonas reinhardtii]|uniref:Uncharacterized protein n=1 Tax=Chlamydomonas reinhardtii TaxID=3055 RepID=A0A2K3DUP5_CHLRE|nr:uncharacterized protein CHLRE_04g227050v5 [Chlamydomonas reinhardtii]PNW84260.1 hypothetical protein CHLRE_04g227050v5 [Chlamydomonas reinhardtii]